MEMKFQKGQPVRFKVEGWTGKVKDYEDNGLQTIAAQFTYTILLDDGDTRGLVNEDQLVAID